MASSLDAETLDAKIASSDLPPPLDDDIAPLAVPNSPIGSTAGTSFGDDDSLYSSHNSRLRPPSLAEPELADRDRSNQADPTSHQLVSGVQMTEGFPLSRYGHLYRFCLLISHYAGLQELTIYLFSIRWAPLNVPLSRRLQTMAVLFHTVTIALCLACFFLCCSFPPFWPPLLVYVISILFSDAASSGTLKYRSEFLRRSYFWSLFASYFPAQLHRAAELDPKGKYIFGYHPHGIISHGAFAAFATDALGFSSLFPGITNTLLTLGSNFRIPFYRDYALWMGLASVSRRSCENLLSRGGHDGKGQGRAITIVIGGAAESLHAEPGTMDLILRKRKGFVKLAFRTGASLVPVIGFGENDLYMQLNTKQHPILHRFQLAVKKAMGFTIPFFHARGVFNYDIGLLPYRKRVNIVVGRPVAPPERTDSPTDEAVDELHRQYEAELVQLWNDFKSEYLDHPDVKLRLDKVVDGKATAVAEPAKGKGEREDTAKADGREKWEHTNGDSLTAPTRANGHLGPEDERFNGITPSHTPVPLSEQESKNDVQKHRTDKTGKAATRA